MVIVVISILIGIVMPSSRPTFHEQLKASAHIIRADLMMMQSEAIALGDTRSAVIDPSSNRIFFEIDGAGDYSDSLPNDMANALSSRGVDIGLLSEISDFGEGMLIRLDELPHHGVPVRILGATRAAAPNTEESFVSYGPLGELTSGSDLTIWLSILNDPRQRLYLPITVNAITGIARIGTICDTGLPACLSVYAAN